MTGASSENMTLGMFRETFNRFVEELKQKFNVRQFARVSEDYSFAKAYECHLAVEPGQGPNWKSYFETYLIHKALRFWPEGEVYNVKFKEDLGGSGELACIFTVAFDSYREGPYRGE